MKRHLLTAGLLSVSLGASALTLEDFSPVYTAQVQREGTNCVVLVLNSAEWGAGLKWTSAAGEDFSRAKYLAVDVENL